mmetsp:Transcript_29211/g.60865  ORF Transcript_29211/g.60865 Transcript_29211/m.60865 type:complete len:188 (-) Transcript_29211:493-1056(-)
MAPTASMRPSRTLPTRKSKAASASSSSSSSSSSFSASGSKNETPGLKTRQESKSPATPRRNGSSNNNNNILFLPTRIPPGSSIRQIHRPNQWSMPRLHAMQPSRTRRRSSIRFFTFLPKEQKGMSVDRSMRRGQSFRRDDRYGLRFANRRTQILHLSRREIGCRGGRRHAVLAGKVGGVFDRVQLFV